MKRENIQAYMIPSTDPHHSEYLPECWKRREWISGFTGSAGDVVITMDKGGLWTDGRYFIQAEKQLQGSGIDLHKMGIPKAQKLEEWIIQELKEGESMGVDPKVLSVESSRKLSKALEERGITLRYIQDNLIDELWKDRPSPSTDPVITLDIQYTGASHQEKINRLREKMGEKDCRAHILCGLDTIAWTFNLRGTDIDFNPLFISYAVITDTQAHLFVNPEKITTEAREFLGDAVEIHPYEAMENHLKELGEKDIRFWIDPATTNRWIILTLGESVRVHEERSPITDFKSMKNETEIKGIRVTQIHDGIAMVRFLKWLEKAVPEGNETEISAADKLEWFRKLGKGFVGLSFDTISGYAGHGAIVHYFPDEESDVPLKPEGIYIVDSGGQYLTGTTDITRTVTLAPPTPEQKEMFTRVLKGHINLSLLKFPKGFTGRQIELPARKSLWEIGKNYNHGTGHGIGHYLNVHEGPMSISPRDTGVPLAPGNVLSNEPGYYKEGEYGMRTENLVLVVKDEELSSDELEMLGFETLTLCPIDLNLVEQSLMIKEELDWLNSYHKDVFESLAPHLDEEHLEWLKVNTREI